MKQTLLIPRSLNQSVGTLVTMLCGVALAGSALAQDKAADAPPRPQNAISGEEGLNRLKEGNERYIKGNMEKHDFVAEREALRSGQNPFAAILGCADSRIAPELAFDTGAGDLFICRVAGNFAEPSSIASLEYAVAVLNVPLVVVLGHEKCGAVDATIKAVEENAEFPGHIPTLIDAIRPAVVTAQKDPKPSLLKSAIRANIRENVKKIETASPILDKAIADGKLKVVGGVYDLATGRVNILE